MLKHASLSALLLLAAGCAQEIPPTSQQVPAGASAAGSMGRLASPSSLAGSLDTGHSFANLPDRGGLVAYPVAAVVRRDGAYTWHRAGLSESHAIRAIRTGMLHVTAPSGEDLAFRYDRHEEYPNGDWSWTGHLVGGSQVDDIVITFGAKAAFGTIAQTGGKAPLRLTIKDGVAWLVETDRSAVAAIHNSATDPTDPDYLVAPGRAAVKPVSSTAVPALGAATASSGPVVDLVLGYTTGFASALGGQSQAETRLNNMVAITNEAYANSQVPGRVRLVKTLQVNYADNTDNGDVLEKLSGYKSGNGGGRTTPDPAFNALRAARDQYGADLVSLVRKFNDPENDGCGIAWLIGGSDNGNGSIDASDQYFGYSVVSDGRDAGTDGKTYFCREETLAHELGHNMGSQHDRATATENGTVNYGIYPYSFGYKTAAGSGNFYTVMAYGDQGQTAYRTFSNPRITSCGGFACGVADQADVARSLTQTMPLIAQFRAEVVTTNNYSLRVCDGGSFDYNGDTVADLFWRNSTAGANAIWNSALSGQPRVVTEVPSQDWQVGAVGDFDGDRRADVMWRHATGGWNVLWPGGNSQEARNLTGVTNNSWKVVGVGDFNLDGRSDLLWHHMLDGWNQVWLGGNAATPLDLSAVPAQEWRVAAVADFNGDRRADILWRHAKDGWNQIWVGGASAIPQSVSPMSTQWVLAATGDFTGDARADLVWRNTSDGRNVLWPSAQSALAIELAAVPSQAWQVASVGDFTADGRYDLVWRHADGWNVIWPSANSQLARDLSPQSSQWQLAGACRVDAFTLP